ncbi:MAG: hypothetical protein AAFR90_06440 [Pseudomonadota bacterium]
MRLPRTLVTITASTFAFPAFAHGLTPGPIGIYFAALHTLTEMPMPLVLISVGLLLGLNKDVPIRQTWLFLILGIAGGLTGILAWRVYIHPILPLLSLTVIAALWAASGVQLPRSAATVIAVMTGYFAGVFFAPAPALWSMQAYAIAGGAIGTCLGLLATYFTVALITGRWNFFWIKLSLRIVASWIAAIAAMVIALSLQ